MEFEWDEDKRELYLEKHDFDFDRVDILIDGRPYLSYRSKYEYEERWLTIALIDDVFYTIVWTP